MSSKKPDILVAPCSYEAAKYACINYHYAKKIPKSKLIHLGVWENNKFIGVIIFGVGANNNLLKPYGLKQGEGCELVRIALKSHQNTVTKIVSLSLKFLKRTNPNLKLVVSFADPEQKHLGKIYQAGNWIYTGRTMASDEYLYKGKRWQGRSFRNSFKGLEKHPDVTIVPGTSKYRYLMPLTKSMRKQILYLSKPYPKAVLV